jgi:hypothetical protein
VVVGLVARPLLVERAKIVLARDAKHESQRAAVLVGKVSRVSIRERILDGKVERVGLSSVLTPGARQLGLEVGDAHEVPALGERHVVTGRALVLRKPANMTDTPATRLTAKTPPRPYRAKPLPTATIVVPAAMRKLADARRRR